MYSQAEVRVAEIFDQHQNPAKFVPLWVKNRSAVGRSRDMVIYDTLNCQDLPDLPGIVFVEADVTVSHFVGSSEEVNPFLPHTPLAFAMHRIENFRFLISFHRGSPDAHGVRPPLHIIEKFAVWDSWGASPEFRVI